jgi:FSR family fosmidomycin resistance protein-like MFS transporter
MAALGTIAATARATRDQRRHRILAVACGVHALHDGFTDLIYVLLPVWQSEFGLSFAELGVLRMLFAGAMAGLQVPMSALAMRCGSPLVLAIGTSLVGGAYVAISLTGAGFYLLLAMLFVGGAGAATQHPIGSALVATAFNDRGARSALSTYNFAGDLGKMAIPAATAWLMAVLTWRGSVGVVGTIGIAAAALVVILLPRGARASLRPRGPLPTTQPDAVAAPCQRSAFPLLLAIGVLDSGTRMGFLAFLPFVLRAKEATTPTIGLALTLIFAGGALGKLTCGWLGSRLGILRTVLLTELGTAVGIVAIAPLPLTGALACLPLIGVALNGTSSVLYGTVPELTSPDRRESAFGLFYTGTIGGGALAPVLYGFAGDAFGPLRAMFIVSAVCLLTLPLAWALRPSLPGR